MGNGSAGYIPQPEIGSNNKPTQSSAEVIQNCLENIRRDQQRIKELEENITIHKERIEIYILIE